MKSISIVVPTLNESGNIADLVERISKSCAKHGLAYEILFVDDHSNDGTQREIVFHKKRHPIELQAKKGPRGKAHSLLQGFTMAQYDVICMLDADLQYPPEAIPVMYNLLIDNSVDVVLSQRKHVSASRTRRLLSAGFHLVFTRALFGFHYDTQAGLKVFRKEVIEAVDIAPAEWSFDLEFIVRALEQNYRILTHDIDFEKRQSGEAKVQVVKVAYELALSSLHLKRHSSTDILKQSYEKSVAHAEKVRDQKRIGGVEWA